MVMQGKYRPEIDGLRALAVLGVVLYHAGFDFIPGGYVGVDVFFVISGFLITGIIRDEVAANGRFSMGRFYARRIKRLLPSLLATVIATFVAGYFILPPDLFQSMGGSSIAAIASVSNFYFWSQSGYFDASNNLKPLLHTWSLSVEEQFYLIWPVALSLTLLRRHRMAVTLAAAVGVGSLALSIVYLSDQAAIYYLLPFRAFELAIGAALVWLRPYTPKRNVVREAMTAFGVIAIVLAMMLYTAHITFPSYNALLPCLGAALVIHGGRSRYTSLLLTNPISVWVGLISYSLYLVHWPITVFYRYVQVGEIGPGVKWGIVAASFGAAFLLYRLVETPCRHLRLVHFKRWQAALLTATLALTASVPAASAWSSGWPWRLPPEVISLIGTQRENIVLDRPPRCFMLPQMSEDDIDASCYTVGPRKDQLPNVLVLGDSTADHLVPGLYAELRGDAHLFEWASSSCPPIPGITVAANSNCGPLMDRFFSKVLPQNNYDLVVIAAHRNWDIMIDGFHKTVAALEAAGTPYVLIGQSVNYRDSVANLVAKHRTLEGLDDFISANQLIGCTGEHGLEALVDSRHFFSMKALLCSDQMARYQDSNSLLYRDNLHLNDRGSIFVARHFVAWLRLSEMMPR